MFGGFSELLTTIEHVVTKSLSTVQTQRLAVVGRWEDPLNISLMVANGWLSFEI